MFDSRRVQFLMLQYYTLLPCKGVNFAMPPVVCCESPESKNAATVRSEICMLGANCYNPRDLRSGEGCGCVPCFSCW